MAVAEGSSRLTDFGADLADTTKMAGYKTKASFKPVMTYSSPKSIYGQVWQCGTTVSSVISVVGGRGLRGAEASTFYLNLKKRMPIFATVG
jgi:hypothetical protein